MQGGGAHGAFTWGVLEAVLDDPIVDVRAITATSAGAMNAACFADGYAVAGKEGAKQRLEEFWTRISAKGGLTAKSVGSSWIDKMFSPFAFMQTLTNFASPYDLNPFDYNPLRDVLAETIDFNRVNAGMGPRLYITATNVHTGKARVFTTGEVTLDAVLASACLPSVFKAVEIDGVPHWDGGYVGNPALFPLFYDEAPRDIVIVNLNPFTRKSTPKSAADIQNRLNEITFNASLIAELRAVAFVQRLLEDEWLSPRLEGRYKRLRIHAIRADKSLCHLSVESKFDTSAAFLQDLRQRGYAAGVDWMAQCGRDVGVRSSVDVRGEFLGIEEQQAQAAE